MADNGLVEKMTVEVCMSRAAEARAEAAVTSEMAARLTLLRIAEGYDHLANRAALRTHQQSNKEPAMS